MNKLGFYIENTTVPFLRDALRQVKPPVILIHAGDRGLLRDIRRELSPDSFVIGRIFVELAEQTAWLDSPDPEAPARAFADRILNFDFGLATEKGANGRLLIDAWMGLNETLPGPASFTNEAVNDDFRRRAAALDRFQVAFRERLRTQGLEAVAFNFGAGNYTKPEHYLDWFPRTLETHKFLGFHEYGWPTLQENPAKGTATAALLYRRAMVGIRLRYGARHTAIITEAGLARMYKYPKSEAGDVGWLFPGETIPEDQYWESLQWYNGQMTQDDYVLGACLYQVGHSGRWETFRHLGTDNSQRPILLMNKIAALNAAPEPPPPPPPPPATEDLATLQRRIAELVANLEAAARLVGDFQVQVQHLQRSLDGLTAVATEVASLPQEVAALLERLNRLQAELERLAAAGQVNPTAIAALQQRVAALKVQLTALQPAAQQAAALSPQVTKARQDLAPLVKGAEEAKALAREIDVLLVEGRRLAAVAGPPPPAPPSPPPVRNALPTAATDRQVTGAPHSYPTRSLGAITQIVVHHTLTRSDVTPERLTEMHQGRGLPGIKYHYVIAGDGTSFHTQPLEAAVPATGVDAVNTGSVAVALAGNFSQSAPSSFQLDGAAEVIAWLLSALGLPTAAVVGRSEVEAGVISPGAQWLQGVSFKDTLLDRVNAILAGG